MYSISHLHFLQSKEDSRPLKAGFHYINQSTFKEYDLESKEM